MRPCVQTVNRQPLHDNCIITTTKKLFPKCVYSRHDAADSVAIHFMISTISFDVSELIPSGKMAVDEGACFKEGILSNHGRVF